MACNMETLLESHMLEDLQFSLVKRLATYVRSLQSIKQPYTRSNELVDKAMEKHADWLALQDFPTPIVRSEAKRNAPGQVKMSPPAQPSSPGKRSRKRSGGLSLPSPLSTPVLAPMTPVRLPALPGTTAVAGEDIFEMDDVRDEDKVMQALWARWIFLNRFVVNKSPAPVTQKKI